jgi:ribonuclease Z
MKPLIYTALAIVTGALLVALLAYNTAPGQDALLRRALERAMAPPPAPPDGLRIVVCGSASPLGNDPARAQACIAAVTPEHLFVFDVGARSPLRIAEARLPLSRLDGVFLTHFHSDHITGLPDVNLASWVAGRKDPLKVYGPSGVQTVVAGFNQAFSLDRQYRVDHHGDALLPPAAGPMEAVTFAPGDVVWQDDLLTVTSIPVDHSPVAPAVGYRIDYRGRSAVISGDTVVTDTLFAAAQGADLLLHDALSRTLLDPMIATAKERNVPVIPAIMTDVIDYHADARSIEARAAAAGVSQLAYYHLVPVPRNALAEKLFARGLADETLLVRDLHTFDLPPGSGDVIISAP